MDVLHAMGLRGLGQDSAFDPAAFDWSTLNDTSTAQAGSTAVDSGGQTIDSQGNIIDNINGTLTTPDGTVYDSYGNIIDSASNTLITPTGATYNAQGQIILPDGTLVDQANNKIITPDGITYTKSGSMFDAGTLLTTDQAKAMILRVAAATGTPTGQWLARTFGGNTVLYRNPQGDIGTMNLSGMVLPAAILLGIFFLGKKGK